MNATKFLTAALAAFITAFVLSYVWHGILMADFYAAGGANIMRPEVNVPQIAAGYAVLALLMAYMFPLGYKGGPAMKEGFRFGALVGLLAWAPANIVLSGVFDYTLATGLTDAAWHVVETGVAGMVLAMVYTRGDSEDGSDE